MNSVVDDKFIQVICDRMEATRDHKTKKYIYREKLFKKFVCEAFNKSEIEFNHVLRDLFHL